MRPSAMNRSLISTADVEQPAGIESQIENQPAHFGGLKFLERGFQFGGGVAAEGRHAQIADAFRRIEKKIPMAVVAAAVAEHGFDVDPLALDGDGFLVVAVRMEDRQFDGRAFLAFEPLDGVVDREVFGAFAVDFEDPVARQKARLVGRRAVDRAQDFQVAFVHRDLNADAAEFAFHAGAKAFDFLRADVGRIGIELGHHAADGRFDQLPPIDLGDVIPLDLIDRIDDEFVKLVIIFLFLRRRILLRRLGEKRAETGTKRESMKSSDKRRNMTILPA